MASRPELHFTTLWEQLFPDVDLHAEHRFDSVRRWRFDFAHLPSQIAIEIEGGVWRGGRHTTGIGFSKDCEKYFAATMQGWMVVRLTPDMIKPSNLMAIANLIRRRSGL